MDGEWFTNSESKVQGCTALKREDMQDRVRMHDADRCRMARRIDNLAKYGCPDSPDLQMSQILDAEKKARDARAILFGGTVLGE